MKERLEQRTCFRLFLANNLTPLVRQAPGLPGSWFARLLTLLISGDIAKKVCIKCAAPVVPSFSLQFSALSSKHYLTQMLVAINWRYWQAGKISRMNMKIQGRLMQALFIDITRFLQKNKVSCFSNRVVCADVFYIYIRFYIFPFLVIGRMTKSSCFQKMTIQLVARKDVINILYLLPNGYYNVCCVTVLWIKMYLLCQFVE